MIPDRFQYFLDDFWNFENFTKSRPSEPVLLMDSLMDSLAYLLLIYGLFMDLLTYLWLMYGFAGLSMAD